MQHSKWSITLHKKQAEIALFCHKDTKIIGTRKQNAKKYFEENL